MRKTLSILFYLILNHSAIGQISGIINNYTKVTAIDLVCNKVTVNSSSEFEEGDTVLIIQMQGATIDEAASTANSSTITFGNINSLNNAGNYEFAHIYNIDGNDIYLKNTLLKSYTVTGSVQLISVPQYTDVTISGTLTAQAWDGNTGGVLVFEASGIVTLNANIDVSKLGFRGGAVNPGNGNACNGSNAVFGALSSTVMGGKGEGIAKYITNKESGRGKQANGGGGGHSNNYGGGGGSNFGAGGRGGNQSSGCNTIFFPNNFWSPGGLALTYSNVANRIYMGGGGGGGHQNNYQAPGPPTWIGATPGGKGGGIVIIKANAIDGNSKSILAKGDSLDTPSWGDSGGGGGAGGTILLSVDNYLSPIITNVKGGKGDRVYTEVNVNLGPGGGGGGGVIWVNTPTQNVNLVTQITGGQPGISWNFDPALTTVCQCPHSAATGATGGIVTNLVIPESSAIFTFPPACLPLPVKLLNFTAKIIGEKIKLEWSTATEKNNAYFIVEKTTDLDSYTTVSTIKGSNNSTSQKSYFAYDDEPSSGISYYRLSQVDLDGTKKVLGIREAKVNKTEKLIKSIFPNPFNNTLTISLNKNIVTADEPIEIKLYNSLGELVYHSFKTSNDLDLTLPDLSPEIYNLVLNIDGQIEIAKVVKSN